MTQKDSWRRLRGEAAASVRLLLSLLESEESDHRLIDGYLETKRLLADAFQALLREQIRPRMELLSEVKDEIRGSMRSSIPSEVPDEYLKIRGYNSPHSELFAYLSLFVGEPVPGGALRILTSDAVHTERRVRELRDLGLELEAERTGGSDVYILRTLRPDVAVAAPVIVRHNVSADKSLDPATRSRLLALLDSD